MKISELNVLQGPNYWSDEHHKLIVLNVDTEQSAEAEKASAKTITNRAAEQLPGFNSEKADLPEHTGIAHAIKNIITALLDLANMECSFSLVKASATPHHYYIVYSYTIEQAGVYAAKAAVKYVNAVIAGQNYLPENDIRELKEICLGYSLGPTTSYILNEVKRRKIPFRQFDYGSLLTLGYGHLQKRIRTAVADTTSGLGIELAGDKDETKKILTEARIPVPKGIIVSSEEELTERINEVPFPLVVKPLDGNHGRGVTTNILSEQQAIEAFRIAQKISETVVIEEFVRGQDHRFLVIDYKLVAVALRRPACVIGDGKSTIEQLVEKTNEDPARGEGAEHVLAPIRIDQTSLRMLQEKNMSVSSVPPAGEIVYLKDTANISAGGTAEDVTDLVHPENKFMAERIAQLFRLDICGVDIMTDSVSEIISHGKGAVVEVNAGPGLRMHSNPQKGKARNVAAPIIDMLFTDANKARIPVVAVTGTNGKTTTTRLIAHMAQQAGYKPGYTTTDGIYINGHLTFTGDCTGFFSSQDVLFDPGIDIAVLECARGGILKHGLGFETCDISIVTNITEDHLGLKDINTLDDLTKLKGVVARSTSESGYAILNADDERVYNLHKELKCKMALFSMNIRNEHIESHIRSGGLAAVCEQGQITIYRNGQKNSIAEVAGIPLSFNGTADFMIRNILASVLASVILGIDVPEILRGLHTFIPSASLTPGRMNIFEFRDFRLMVDYVHNKDGFEQMKSFITQQPATEKTGVIGVAGDRRDEDIISIGRSTAGMFDKIIIRQDKNLRDKSEEEISRLLMKGIREVSADVPVSFINDERKAIEEAIRTAPEGALIFVCADHVNETLEMIEQLHLQDQHSTHHI